MITKEVVKKEDKKSEEGTNEFHQDEETAKRIIEVNRQITLHRKAARGNEATEGLIQWVRQRPKLTQQQIERIERNKEAAIKKTIVSKCIKNALKWYQNSLTCVD